MQIVCRPRPTSYCGLRRRKISLTRMLPNCPRARSTLAPVWESSAPLSSPHMGIAHKPGERFERKKRPPFMAVPEKSDSKITVQTQARSFARKVRIEFFLLPPPPRHAEGGRRRGWESCARLKSRQTNYPTVNLTAYCAAKKI